MSTTRGTHPINTVHLVAGLVFAGLLGIWALVVADRVPTDDLRWLFPLPLLFAGAAGLAAFAVGRLRSGSDVQAPVEQESGSGDSVAELDRDDYDYLETIIGDEGPDEPTQVIGR